MSIDDEVRNRGKYYGYPECCTNYFADELNDLEAIQTKRIKQMGDYYDLFVSMYCTPCPKCYGTLLRNYKEVKKIYEVKRE